LELAIRPTFVVIPALLLVLQARLAEAAGSTQLAETGGFLLGNACRCGVLTERLEHAGKIIHDLIVAASFDSTEEAAADSRFAEIFLANAFPDQNGDALIPSCEVVVAQFAASSDIISRPACTEQKNHPLSNPVVKKS
jgi:hypothetical protein